MLGINRRQDAVAKVDAIYTDLVEKRGFAPRPAMLARDLNGLLAWRWARGKGPPEESGPHRGPEG